MQFDNHFLHSFLVEVMEPGEASEHVSVGDRTERDDSVCTHVDERGRNFILEREALLRCNDERNFTSFPETAPRSARLKLSTASGTVSSTGFVSSFSLLGHVFRIYFGSLNFLVSKHRFESCSKHDSNDSI